MTGILGKGMALTASMLFFGAVGCGVLESAAGVDGGPQSPAPQPQQQGKPLSEFLQTNAPGGSAAPAEWDDASSFALGYVASTAELDVDGVASFELDLLGMFTPSGGRGLSVTTGVDVSWQVFAADGSISEVEADDAIDMLNGGDALVFAVSSLPITNDLIQADIGVGIIELEDGQDWGIGISDCYWGALAAGSTVTIEADGSVSLTIESWDYNGNVTELDVSVPAGVTVEYYDDFGMPVDMDLADLVEMVNAAPEEFSVDACGSGLDANGVFIADDYAAFYSNAGDIDWDWDFGDMFSGTLEGPAELVNGQAHFTLTDSEGWNWLVDDNGNLISTVDVVTSDDAVIYTYIYTVGGGVYEWEEAEADAAGLVDLLNNSNDDEVYIDVFGEFDTATGVLTADNVTFSATVVDGDLFDGYRDDTVDIVESNGDLSFAVVGWDRFGSIAVTFASGGSAWLVSFDSVTGEMLIDAISGQDLLDALESPDLELSLIGEDDQANMTFAANEMYLIKYNMVIDGGFDGSYDSGVVDGLATLDANGEISFDLVSDMSGDTIHVVVAADAKLLLDNAASSAQGIVDALNAGDAYVLLTGEEDRATGTFAATTISVYAGMGGGGGHNP